MYNPEVVQDKSAMAYNPTPAYGYGNNDFLDYHDTSDHFDQIDRASHGSGADACCPLVVDPLLFLAVLLIIAIGTYSLNTYITMNSAAIGRKKRSLLEPESTGNKLFDFVWHGESIKCFFKRKALQL